MILEISFVYKYFVYIFFNCGSVYTALEQNPRRTSKGDKKSTKKAKQRLNALWLGGKCYFLLLGIWNYNLIYFPYMNTKKLHKHCSLNSLHSKFFSSLSHSGNFQHLRKKLLKEKQDLDNYTFFK